MTCIAAVRLGNKTFVCSDDAIDSGLRIRTDNKVFQPCSRLAICFSGDVYAWTALRFPEDKFKNIHKTIPRTPFDPVRWVVEKLIPLLRPTEDQFPLQKKDGFELLIIVDRHMVYVDSRWAVVCECADRFAAIGSGAPVALGYLSALEDHGRLPAFGAYNAVEIAAKYVPTVGAPNTCITVDCLEGTK